MKMILRLIEKIENNFKRIQTALEKIEKTLDRAEERKG